MKSKYFGTKCCHYDFIKFFLNSKFKVVTSDNLINAIEIAMYDFDRFDLQFERAFRTWELQEGYPVIDVKYDSTTRRFRIVQERFFDDITRNQNDQSSWYIPINYVSASNANFDNTTFTHYFVNGTQQLEISDTNHNENDWFIFNKQQIGYYRVNYDEKNWEALSTALKNDDFEKIHVLNRMQILDDSFSLADAGYLDFSIPYDILLYLRHELNFFPWDIAIEHINKLFAVFGPRNHILNVSYCILSKSNIIAMIQFFKLFFVEICISSIEIILWTI